MTIGRYGCIDYRQQRGLIIANNVNTDWCIWNKWHFSNVIYWPFSVILALLAYRVTARCRVIAGCFCGGTPHWSQHRDNPLSTALSRSWLRRRIFGRRFGLLSKFFDLSYALRPSVRRISSQLKFAVNRKVLRLQTTSRLTCLKFEQTGESVVDRMHLTWV